MYPTYITKEKLQTFIKLSLIEDIEDGDHTTLACIDQNAKGKAILWAKDKGVIAGVLVATEIIKFVQPDAYINWNVADGDKVFKGQKLMEINANIQTILTAERLLLNCMQRMSGIATTTHKLTGLIGHTKARLLDTRKTTPLVRMLEKWAVLIGGGVNHRYGLFDMILIKDNHIDYNRSIDIAIEKAIDYTENTKALKIIVEIRTLDELDIALRYSQKIHRLLLDNMDLDTLNEAVKRCNGKVLTEASGGITKKTIVPIAETGVDFISVGMLTHSIKSLDLSLKAQII